MLTKGLSSRIFSSVFVLALILSLVSVGATSTQAAGRCYVNDNAAGANTGASWINAYTSLQSAFADSCTEIWVAAGVYKPTSGTDRNATFQLENGVAVYGGFAGTETMLSQRNIASNPTILSGDIDNNDSQSPIITDIETVTGNATNSYTVVRGADGAILDGFTITAAYRDYDNGSCSAGCGGGMLNYSSSPVLQNIAFRGNFSFSGGAMSNRGGSPTLTNVTFSGNKSGWHGGAIYNWSSSPTLTNVTFVNNYTPGLGGGIINNGGSNLILTNATFSGNSGGTGGGIYNMSNSSLTLKNVIITNSPRGGDCQSGTSLDPSSSNNLLQSTGTNACGLTNGVNGNQIGVNPLLGALGNYGGPTQTIPLLPGSPAIDTGDDSTCAASDQRGVARPQGAHCDIGSYEVFNIYHVKPIAGGMNNCASWDDACTLQTALSRATVGNEIWAAAGVYKPGTDRNNTFQLVSDVAVYGGFAGTETARGQRNPTANVTILSGDIDNNDLNSDGDFIAEIYTDIQGSNSYHVATGATNATLDGFTITAGNANSGGAGGIRIETNTGITLANLEISGNSGAQGGGIAVGTSNLTMTNIMFAGNSTTDTGGGLFLWTSTATLTNATFYNNRARYGGGMGSHWSAATLNNVTFGNNTATSGLGGGILNNFDTVAQIHNAVFWGNSGGQIQNYNGGWSNVSDSVVQGGFAGGTNIITTNPLLGAFGNYGGYTQTIPLLSGSSAIDAGNDGACAASDQRGVARPQGAHCDIGAYESLSVYYVKPATSGTGTCDSWDNACTLQTALYLAGNGTEIWVAAGTHKPTTGTDRTISFQLKNGVGVYGGFAGTETLRDQRNPTTNIATLSGDIGAAGNNSDNSYHVVFGAAGATLDGFTITAGNANGSSTNSRGGGMYNSSSSPTVTNVIFSGNSATHGGGMYNSQSNPIVTEVTFSDNLAEYGGGMHNYQSNPIITDVVFSSNPAGYGGGMYNNNSSPAVTNVTFSGNLASYGGGIYNISGSPAIMEVTFYDNSATYNGGGMYNDQSGPTVTNTTFNDNSAGNGGGIFNDNSSPVITNVTISNNSAANNGGGMYSYNSNPMLKNAIIANSTGGGDCVLDASSTLNPASSNNLIQSTGVNACGLTNGVDGNLIGFNPLLGTFGGYGGATQTIPLLPGSPAIDAGEDAACPATDQRGAARPKGLHCDIGAVEMDPATFHTISGRVTESGVGLAGVTITYGSASTTTNANGYYSFSVHDVWTGSVTPSRADYAFIPASRNYTNVTFNQLNQNYTAVSDTYTISGSAGIGGAAITYTGGSTTADGAGDYSFVVAYGWSGTVTPSRIGYTFTPASRSYNNVVSNQTGQNYTPAINTYTISGNAGVGAATITYTGGSTTANSAGDYSFNVPYGWSGTVTPSKTGFTFTPASRSYTGISSNLTNQNFASEQDTICSEVPPITPGEELSGFLSSADDIDPYHFTVTEPFTTIKATLTPPTIDSEIELELHNACDGLWNFTEAVDIGYVVDIGGTNDQNIYVTFNVGLDTGTYYLVVRPKTGSVIYSDLPYRLHLELDAANLELVNTIILYNPSRFKAAYTTGSESGDLMMMSKMMGDLAMLADHSTVNGVIIQLDWFGDGLEGTGDDEYDVNLAYANWDAVQRTGYPDDQGYAEANVAAAREVSNAIRAAMLHYMDTYGKRLIEPGYVVIIGDDDQIPFWREPIEAPHGNWRTETDYFSDLGDTVDSPIDAALFGDYTLTDNYYGNYMERGASGEFNFLPGLAVGRLVDTPERIQTMLETYLEQDGVANLYGGEAAVAGYDFLADTAQWSCNYLGNDGGLSTSCTVNNTFNSSTLLQQFIANGPNVSAFFGHASHDRFIAPASPNNLTASMIQGAVFPADLDDILWWSIGCHSGLPMPRSETAPLSLIQALAGQKVTYIGNTGWAWGVKGGMGYSEIMGQLLAKRLRSNTLSVGEALRLAKQDYFFKVMLDSFGKGKFSFSSYDEKVMAETTLYGLPMLRYSFPGTPPASMRADKAPETLERVETTPLPAATTTDFHPLQLKVSNLTQAPNSATDGTYYTGTEGNLSASPDSPILPQSEYFNFDTSLGRGRGVIWLGGKYNVVHNNNPLIATLNELTSPPDDETAFNGTFPFLPAALADLERLDGTIFNHLTFQTGQFVGNQTSGNLRLFTEMEFLVGLDETPNETADLIQPVVEPPVVTGQDTVNPALNVNVSDEDAGIYKVYFTYTQDDPQAASGIWKSLEMTPNAAGECPASDTFILERDRIPVGDVRYFIQAMDCSGNVSVITDNGQYYSLAVLNRYTISGYITGNQQDIAGVTITYTGGSTTSNANGYYSFPVYHGWSGTVTPARTGYTFTPASRTYAGVTSNQANQDFAAIINAFAISGNAGAGNAIITYTGGMTVADANGNYVFTVPYNWSGSATPSRVGYRFSPASRSYVNVTYDRPDQNYTATQETLTVSGNAGIGGATITYTGGSTTTDPNGDYAFTVAYDWTGTVTPSKAGYYFTPANRSYFNVTSDQPDQDYALALNVYTISGNAGIGYAAITYTGGSTTAGADGDYAFNVDHGWTGTVIPSRTGYTFTPSEKGYTNLTSDQPNQNYVAEPNTYTISGNVGIGYATITYTGGSTTADFAGGYAFTITHGWSGSVVPSKTGYTFSPSSRDYFNTTSSQANQNYTAIREAYILSGNVGIAGVTISTGDTNATSDENGNYSLLVAQHWTGTVTPSKVGYTFDPPSMDYTDVMTDQLNQDYTSIFAFPNSLSPGNVIPQAADSVHVRQPTFTWEKVPGAVSYTVEVVRSNYCTTFAVKSINVIVATNSYTPGASLSASTVYCWRVRANGLGISRAYSLVRTFTTGNPPSTPIPTVPANNALVATARPLFDWSDSTLPAGTTLEEYEFQIDTDSTFAATASHFTPNSNWTPGADLSRAATYYWRVRAWNTAGDFSAWSAARKIRISYAAPALISPADTSVTGSLKPTFTWNAVPGATSYRIQISPYANFSVILSNATTTGTTFTPTLSLPAHRTFHWRVQALGVFGTGEWSTVWTFSTP